MISAKEARDRMNKGELERAIEEVERATLCRKDKRTSLWYDCYHLATLREIKSMLKDNGYQCRFRLYGLSVSWRR